MTGRGDGKIIRPSPNAPIQIGISLSTQPDPFPSDLSSPLYIVITARILRSPRPDTPITLCAHLNPFASLQTLGNRSIKNIVCISAARSATNFETSSQLAAQVAQLEITQKAAKNPKEIVIWPIGWPNYNTGARRPNLFQSWDFVTVKPGEDLVVKHEIRAQKIIDAGIEKWERYRVELTDKALGTGSWCYGDIEDFEKEGVQLGYSPRRRDEELEKELDEELEDWESDEDRTDDGKGGEADKWIHSEPSEDLRLVVEKGWAEFDVV